MSRRETITSMLRSKLSALAPGKHRVTLDVEGQPVDFRIRIAPKSDILFVHFHGSVNREKHFLPKFPSFVAALDVHQIAMPDPTMLLVDKPFNASWYAGHDGFDTQSILTEIFAAVVDELRVGRTIYFGNSSGGFASLYFSHRHGGSVAIAGNPQTNILAHRQHIVSAYREHCWPDAATNEDAAKQTCLDLTTLYSKGFENTVIYVQSLGDRRHYLGQMMPFAAAIKDTADANRFLLHCDFFGQLGHAAALETYVEWMKAVVSSPTLAPNDLLTTVHEVRNKGRKQSGHAEAGGTRPVQAIKGYAEDDLALADRLAKWRAMSSSELDGATR